MFLLIFVFSGKRVELDESDVPSWVLPGIGVAVPETVEESPGFPIRCTFRRAV